MKIKKCYVVLLALGSFVGYKWYQHYQWQQLMLSGYCEKDGTYFDNRHTKQELIDKAILYVLKEQTQQTYDAYSDELLDIKQYTTMEEFKKMNPDCCKVSSGLVDAPPEYYDFELEGKAYKYVTIKYKKYYLNNQKYDYTADYIVFDNCGKLQNLNDLD